MATAYAYKKQLQVLCKTFGGLFSYYNPRKMILVFRRLGQQSDYLCKI